MKHVGIDEIINNVAKNLGLLERVYLTGSFVKGNDSKIIDLVFIGEIDEAYLDTLIAKSEKLIKRKINVKVVSIKDFNETNYIDKQNYLLCWTNS
jgi:predicted nucleotidyltransferase